MITSETIIKMKDNATEINSNISTSFVPLLTAQDYSTVTISATAWLLLESVLRYMDKDEVWICCLYDLIRTKILIIPK